jgi:hypothetical protein
MHSDKERKKTISRTMWFLPHPLFPLSCQQVVFFFLGRPVCRRSSLLITDGRRGGGGTKSYDNEKAWSSINHSMLSDSDKTYQLEPD